MSGSTQVSTQQKYYLLVLETPRKAFKYDPTVDENGLNQEGRYHANAKKKFDAVIERITPYLNEYFESLSKDSNKKWNLLEWGKDGKKKGKSQIFRIDYAQISLKFDRTPSKNELENIESQIQSILNSWVGHDGKLVIQSLDYDEITKQELEKINKMKKIIQKGSKKIDIDKEKDPFILITPMRNKLSCSTGEHKFGSETWSFYNPKEKGWFGFKKAKPVEVSNMEIHMTSLHDLLLSSELKKFLEGISVN